MTVIHNEAFGQSEQPRVEVNVTQDMINLLQSGFEKENISALPVSQNTSSANIEPNTQNSNMPANYTTGLRIGPIFLEDKTIPEGDVLYLYDITPLKIEDAHITVKLPCDEDGSPLTNILIGKNSKFHPANLEMQSGFSRFGESCLYKSNIGENATESVSEILLANNSTEDIDLPPTSVIMINIDKISIDDRE
jgi:hypothetical protein